jgi:hypothetical protein
MPDCAAPVRNAYTGTLPSLGKPSRAGRSSRVLQAPAICNKNRLSHAVPASPWNQNRSEEARHKGGASA